MQTNTIQRRKLLLTATAATAGFATTGFAQNKKTPSFDRTCDVLVVGAGMAGLTAAKTLAKQGLKVTVVEKRNWVGGDAIYSTGVVLGAQTRFHQRDGIVEGVSIEDYWKRLNQGLFDEPVSKVRDNMPESPSYSGIAKHDPAVLRACAEKLPAVADFLYENGVNVLPIPKAAPFLLPTPKGAMGDLAKRLRADIDKMGGTFLMQTSAQELLQDDSGAVVGVRVRTRDAREIAIGAKSVILATGGFLDNDKLMRHYKRYWSTAPKGFAFVGGGIPTDRTGDGIVLAKAIGAALEDMESVPKFYTATQKGVASFSWLMLDTDKAYVVDKTGRRFVNEPQARYSGCALAMLRLGVDGGYVLFDEETFSGKNAARWQFAKVLQEGGLVKADTAEELAKLAGVDAKGLKETIETISRDAAKGTDSQFGRKDARFKGLKAPYYLSKPYWPVMFKTEGGIEVNSRFEVLRHSDLSAIDGLYAVGATCGSISTRLCDVFASGLAVAQEVAKSRR
ncbi:MAG: FAD-dependent oxidoreductase [Sutterellaceae bacterium]|nr:FAD-dependent oxidoreductase [Sutterellaceae bacterium]